MINLYIYKNLEKWYANDPCFLDLVLNKVNDSRDLNKRYSNRADFHKHFSSWVYASNESSDMAYPRVSTMSTDFPVSMGFECSHEINLDFLVSVDTRSPSALRYKNLTYKSVEEFIGLMARALTRPFSFDIKDDDDSLRHTNLFRELMCTPQIQTDDCGKEYSPRWNYNINAFPTADAQVDQVRGTGTESELVEFNVRIPLVVNAYADNSICDGDCKPFNFASDCGC